MADVELVEPRIQIKQWRELLMDTTIHFQLYELKDSLYLWIGTSTPSMNNLYLSIQTDFDKYASVMSVMGNNANASSLSAKLAKLMARPCFVSYNVEAMGDLHEWVQMKVLEKFKSEFVSV
eukprot:TRINITY_DN6080_c0_g1_i1.p1 TRINITY_DN6080_c0_g1~~TRINITY_DN6080_c0_g1_i1.p1  ORF type:complete len:121 (+),score=12.02 TRINITY_DN6080_c0_g1_i1:22-384(+)